MIRHCIRVCVVVVVVAGSLVVAAPAYAGGNSDAAHACQQGGWQDWVREDGTTFKNTGACVSYAAHGGVLSPAYTATRQVCEEHGGTLVVADSPPDLWTCIGMSSYDVELQTRCVADGGIYFSLTFGPPYNFGCETES